ncbi:hypothetical protein F7734_42070 [Scytonema sp. UIC 10036]|uniref:hypothetical protein n=1 Tax=Scytonema sp. UIC 10036 TaxID=2304196 RepID=UPI0012DA6FBF|nr:hypothetical protein [Scytonema sp. UIC 10036]MUG98534.1 hypothetical protein [Scytonema sp. UIC 10036]
MSKTICVGLISFSVFLGNIGQSSASNNTEKQTFKYQGFARTASIMSSINSYHELNFLFSARDERRADCLRAGNCKR